MKKPILVVFAFAFIVFIGLLLVKSYKFAATSGLIAANIEALAQNESLDAGEVGNNNYTINTHTTRDIYNENDCCYTIITTTEVDCLPDGKADCTPGTRVDVVTGHRFSHI